MADAFTERFGRRPRLFQAPGRINVIGEHVDYCGGLVMPAAIDRHCLVAIAANASNALTVASANLKPEARLALDHLSAKHDWTDYVAGVAAILTKPACPLKAPTSSSIPMCRSAPG